MKRSQLPTILKGWKWLLTTAKVTLDTFCHSRTHLQAQLVLRRIYWASESLHLISNMIKLAARAPKSLDKQHPSAGKEKTIPLIKNRPSTSQTATTANSCQQIWLSPRRPKKQIWAPITVFEEICLWKNLTPIYLEIKVTIYSSCPRTAFKTKGLQEQLSLRWERSMRINKWMIT